MVSKLIFIWSSRDHHGIKPETAIRSHVWNVKINVTQGQWMLLWFYERHNLVSHPWPLPFCHCGWKGESSFIAVCQERQRSTHRRPPNQHLKCSVVLRVYRQYYTEGFGLNTSTHVIRRQFQILAQLTSLNLSPFLLCFLHCFQSDLFSVPQGWIDQQGRDDSLLPAGQSTAAV